MKRLVLEHEVQTNERFVSVTEQTKNEVRSKVINHIRETVVVGLGHCASEDENLVVYISELSGYTLTIQTEIQDYFSGETTQETRTIDRLEVDCGDGLWIYDTKGDEYALRELSTDFIFNIGVLVDKWFHNIKTEKPYTTYHTSSVNENERTMSDNI